MVTGLWSAVRSVIIRVINNIGRLRSGSDLFNHSYLITRCELIIIITIFREQVDVTKKLSCKASVSVKFTALKNRFPLSSQFPRGQTAKNEQMETLAMQGTKKYSRPDARVESLLINV